MAYDIKLMKLTNGEMVLGKLDREANTLKDVALIQTIPTQQGAQMLLLPFGYPFEMDFAGEISLEHVLYEYKTFPEELKNKYFEATTNLTISKPGDLRGLNLAPGANPAKGGAFPGLIKK